ncbi:MAG: glycosyltransferase family 2 protein [Elusimicrobia bacterium]|nr:glycosyltransferase family 2 protein [Candidatus Obscuribacterium magneticum]
MPESDIRFLSVVIPCYNEETNIPRFQKELLDTFSQFNFQKEFIFIDDGSTDRTAELLAGIVKTNPQARLIRHESNRGLGAALQTGIAQAQGDALLTIDADLTFHPGQFPLLLQAYQPGIDCVMGSPIKGQLEGVSPVRKLLSLGVNKIYGILLGIPLTSMSSIFRLYRTAPLKELPLTSRAFDINAEIVFRLLERKRPIDEVAAVLTQRKGGSSKIRISREIRNHLRMFIKIIAWRLSS